MQLSGPQAQAAAFGIAAVLPKVNLTLHACAIMPDHVHVVAAAHGLSGDEIIECLKRAGTRGMNQAGLHPLREFPKASNRLPSPWGGGGWKVMLFTHAKVRTAIQYVEENPVRAGFKPQRWSFVVPYEG